MLVWTDIETTGLDPQKDDILEVAFAITTDDLKPVITTSHFVEGDLGKCNDFVREMHEKSGLFEMLRHPQARAWPLPELEVWLCEWLREHLGAEKPPLAGSSVHFDRSFLRAKMPRVVQAVSYRNVDVSSVKELAQRWALPVFEARPVGLRSHRAITDIWDSIAELSHYREHFLRAA